MLRHGYFIKPDIQLCLLIADVVQTYIYLGNRINNDAYKNDINEIVIDIDRHNYLNCIQFFNG